MTLTRTGPTDHDGPSTIDIPLRRQVYLGVDPTDQRRCWSTAEDSIGLVGPPRYGKTSGIITPALLHWDGPAVATSTRGDLLAACGLQRARIAAPHGGRVYVYDPFTSTTPPADDGSTNATSGTVSGDITGLHWSPLAGCADPTVCYRRVAAMVAVVGRGVTDADHWRAGAAVILRATFHAAAMDGQPVAEVRRWLANQDTRTPADILRRATATTARGWADDLQAISLLGDRERGSFYSVARNTLDATAEPRVLASTTGADLNLDHFLNTHSTLFIVGPRHYQQVAAPMIVGLVDSIDHRAAELAATAGHGRLDPPLLLALDEVANIAPLQSLPALVSEGGGRGVITLWSAQSLAHLRARYGTDEQQAILTATTAKLIFGAISNGADLRDISGWAGEYREPQSTYYAGGSAIAAMRSPAQPGHPAGQLANPDDVGRMHAVGQLYRPVLPIDALQQLPPLHAWLFYRSDPPLLVETTPAGRLEPYRHLITATSTPAAPGPATSHPADADPQEAP